MTQHKGNVAIAVAIVAAGALIAAALYFALGTGAGGTGTPNDVQQEPAQDIRGVQTDDHIQGNPDAEVVIVEFSDTECPFCKNFHETMNQLITEYDDSELAWVYRHFPIPQLHAKAQREAEAIECAAELGGNDGFWAYTNRLYDITPSNDGLADSQLPEIAEFAGLDVDAFTTCLESGDMAPRVQEDYDEVVAAGGRGTPHNIILYNGEQYTLEGAQSIETMRQIVDQLLAGEIGGE